MDGNPASAAAAPSVEEGSNVEDGLPVLKEEDAEQVIVLDQNDTTGPPDEENGTEDNDASMGDGEDETGGEEEGDTMEDIPDDAMLVLQKHSSETLAIAANPVDLNLIASGGRDDIAILWDLQQGKDLVELDGQGESVSSVAFNHDGTLLATGSENGAINVMFLKGAEAPQTVLDGPAEAISFLSWHSRGPLLLAGSEDRSAYMWNAKKGVFKMAFVGHEDAVTAGFFSSDGEKVITASRDSSVRVWSPYTGAALHRIQTNQPGISSRFHGADIHCLAMGFADTPLSMIVASGCAAGNVYLSNAETGQVVSQLPTHEGGVEALAFSSPSFKPLLLASGGADGTIRVRDVEAGAERCTFSHPPVVTKLRWHPDLPLLISASSSGTLCVWNAQTGEKKAEFRGHRDFVSDFCLAGGDKFIASTSGDSTVRVFDLRPLLAS